MTVMKVQGATMSTETVEYLTGKLVVTLNFAISIIVQFSDDEDSDAEITDELTNDKRKVLEFFGTATLNELQLMQYCSKKKGEAIIEERPFTGWIDLVNQLNIGNSTNKIQFITFPGYQAANQQVS